ncbi:AraC family transcriptional regulator [Leisingera sp. ANG59]|uniref:helix-turn-helix domain-containing protein n=1 Tax=Leisingera sp. ANG59 TaxID=2675221 RepID=UPI001C2DD646|nr:AraC family transcriptional regulator [Leisingera sp. ANG59]
MTQRESGYRPAIVFLSACITLLVVVGLRWSYEAPVFRFLQPVTAAFLPPAAWLCFSGLNGLAKGPAWHHFVPTGIVFVLSALWPWVYPPIDALLAALFLGYGATLMRRGLAGADLLTGARLSDAPQSGRAAACAGGLLLFSGMVDLAIAMDFGLGGGGHVRGIVSAANLLVLPPIAWAVIVMVRCVPQPESAPVAGNSEDPAWQGLPAPADNQVMAEVDRILAERRLYRDPDLTLDRLSRRLGIPARQVSRAINRKLGQNVSQAINGWRIRDAMELLVETDRPVTEIMFDCGFQTKSNFNREFRRVAGTSPSGWRRQARSGTIASVSAVEAFPPES